MCYVGSMRRATREAVFKPRRRKTTAGKPETLDRWIERTLKQDPPRSKSLIVTLFGDSLTPRTDSIWLGDLIAILRPFQVDERLARTSAFRLSEEGWLEAKREGRRSRYSLTPSGLHRVQHAYRRIYDPPVEHWDGRWTLVLLNKIRSPLARRIELRRELGWEGFGLLAPGIFLHPCADRAALHEVLERLTLAPNVAVLEARDLDAVSSCPMTKLAAECWNLELVAGQYRKFLKRFQPAFDALLSTGVSQIYPLHPQTAFTLQTLLIHAFRRIVLHDPRLPAALLPKDWPGHTAYKLCREIYLLTCRPTQTYLAGHLHDTANLSISPDKAYRRRFGGLD